MKKNRGVLYIRYDKDTFCGRVIEKFKRTSGRQLNGTVVNLIFLSELVEPQDWHDIDLKDLNCAYYESLKLFSDKLNQAHYKIDNLASQLIRQKYRKANSYQAIKDVKLESKISETQTKVQE